MTLSQSRAAIIITGQNSNIRSVIYIPGRHIGLIDTCAEVLHWVNLGVYDWNLDGGSPPHHLWVSQLEAIALGVDASILMNKKKVITIVTFDDASQDTTAD
jgi:hypothetical protein